MSFMLVRGKIYRCADCEYSVKIDYQGGAQLTQIGEWNVLHQHMLEHQPLLPMWFPKSRQLENIIDLGRGFMPWLPWGRGSHYLLDIGFCEACKNKRCEGFDGNRGERIDHLGGKTDKIRLQAIDAIGELVPELLDAVITETSLEELEKVMGLSLREKVTGDDVSPKERGLRIKRYIHQHHHSRLLPHLQKKLLARNAVKRTLKEYTQKSQHLFKELQELLQTDDPVFMPHSTNHCENLNDYILTETSLRVPKSGSSDIIFYYEHEATQIQYTPSLQIDHQSIHLEGTKKMLRERVENLLNIG